MCFGIKQPGPHLRIRCLLAGWTESACKEGNPGSIPGWERSPGERDQLPTLIFMGFRGGSDGKESACSAGDLDSIPWLGRSPGGGHGNSLQYSCLEHLHGQRCLVGSSPQDHKVRHSGATKHSWVVSCGSPVGLLSLPDCVPVAKLFWGLDGLMQVTSPRKAWHVVSPS